jgi:hypothetical protein
MNTSRARGRRCITACVGVTAVALSGCGSVTPGTVAGLVGALQCRNDKGQVIVHGHKERLYVCEFVGRNFECVGISDGPARIRTALVRKQFAKRPVSDRPACVR